MKVPHNSIFKDNILIRSHQPVLPTDFESAISNLEDLYKEKIFVFIIRSLLDRMLARDLSKLRKIFCTTKKLTILLDSGGGDMDGTYQIIRWIKDHCENIRILVPSYAKSAATFLCLMADEIIMSPTAELGPLDAQILDPRDKKKRMSAIDGFKTLEYLRQYAMETLDLTTLLFLKRSNMTLNEAIAESVKFVSVIMEPLYKQVDPLNLGEYSRILAIGEEYGKRVLQKNGSIKTDSKILLNKMIWSYPSHSFVIDYEEARSLGLNVRLFNDTELEFIDILYPHLYNQSFECVGFLKDTVMEIKKDEKNDKDLGLGLPIEVPEKI